MADARNAEQPRTIFLNDYRPPSYLIDTVELRVVLNEDVTRVRARLALRRNGGVATHEPLVLDGHDMRLVSVALDGRVLAAAEYRVDPEALSIERVPAHFTLEIETELRPQDNTSLEGLYKSSGNFCTQCEAQGFRKITYFIDRPDVMARYTVTLDADPSRYPVLLSNGNLTARGASEGGRHWATWNDPFPKPCYLFAMVAGDLACVEDEFITMSGRKVQLRIYVQQHNIAQTAHAMRSLKKAMRWDEEVYGREYDLDVFMIVVVDDFNMGAMENKGLNIFNSRFVLAQPQSATDGDYQAIEGIVGHEYFHNWSGNRVTCRDWFQLSLKEGFTVFRDQEFSADQGSRAVKRIVDANILRTHQFREDAGPMAHPVRPASYVEINNFYTLTVYNKGAEVIRMQHNILGAEDFRKGTDLYFTRHDGHAVTTDDFVRALEDANGVDLTQFRLWYSQAGTPELHITRAYDAQRKTYTLRVTQTCPATPGQTDKLPFHIPFAVGLLDRDGRDLPLQLEGETDAGATSRVLAVREREQQFTFINIPHEPVPSFLRGFSAPVKIDIALSDAERCFLMAHDSDAFNRWDAGQQLAVKIILNLVALQQQGEALTLDPDYVRAVRLVLDDQHADPAFVAHAIALPNETYIAEFMEVIDPVAIHSACRFIRRELATQLRDVFARLYASHQDHGEYSLEPVAMGRRSLKNACLGYLMELDDPIARAQCLEQFRHGGNMTDRFAALVYLVNTVGVERDVALNEFFETWRHDALVLDKWFAIQASSRLSDTLDRVRALIRHPAFNIKNPNKVRSVVGAFAQNQACFHASSGEGYAWVAERVIELNALNPQIAARLTGAFALWRRYDPARQELMRVQLERIRETPNLSKDVYEIVARSLANPA